MEQTFNDLLTSLLSSNDNLNEQDLNLLIEQKCQEWGLSEEEISLLKETNEYIDGFAENIASLEKAKGNGKSRKDWMLTEIDRITEGRTEEEKAKIVSAISETNEKMIEETTTQE